MLKKLFLVCLLTISFSGAAFAIEFSADTLSTTRDGQKMSGKIHFKTDKFRMEMKSHEGAAVMITRIDKKVVWSIMPEQKMYLEMPFDLSNKPKVEEKVAGEIERKEVGRETIDGHPTKKYLITYQTGDRKDRLYQWLATDINFPVKTAAVDGSWSQEFKNIKMGPQRDSLFEVPAGFQKMQMPGGMNFRHMKQR